MQKRKILIIVFTLIVLGGIYFKFHSTASSPDEDAIVVQASTVKETALPMEAHAIGTLVARSVEITPETAGHVETINFQDGSEVKKGAVLVQLDDAVFKAKYQSAAAKLVYSENNYNRMVFLGKHGAIAQQAIDQADADLKEKRADAEEAQVTLNKMKLIAPFDGVIAKSKVNPGDYVTIGQAIVTLTDIKHLHIEYNVPEIYLPSLKLGQTVAVTTATYPGKVFYGKLAFISPSINPENRSVSLYAEVPNDSGALASGMFVNVSHALGQQNHALMIPARSLVPILDGEQVFKVISGKAYAVSVETGKRTGDQVEVISGLNAGDWVITDGQLKVKNGVSVKVKT